MHTFQQEITKPENSSDFEAMCANIYGHIFGDQFAKRNGRSGQKQAGVDIYVESKDGRIGIQSKRYQDGRLKLLHILQEVGKAERGGAAIVKLIIATTAANDAVLLQEVQKLSDTRVANNQFPVDVEFWSDICAHVHRHVLLQDHYCPNSPGAMFGRIESFNTDQAAAMEQQSATMAQILAAVQRCQLPSSDQSLPAARDDSVNRIIGAQIDAVNDLLIATKYREAAERLTLIGQNFTSFDAHQKARWHVQRGICRAHLQSGPEAAADFLEAAKLFPSDEKMAAAKVRGLLLQGDATKAIAVGTALMDEFPASVHVWRATLQAKIAANEPVSEASLLPDMDKDSETLQILSWAALAQDDFEGALRYAHLALSLPNAGYYARSAALTAILSSATSDPFRRAYGLIDQSILDALVETVATFEPRSEKLWVNQSKTTLPADATNLAYAYLMLNQPQIANSVLSESTAHFVETPRCVTVQLEVLRSMNCMAEFCALAKEKIHFIENSALLMVAESAANASDVELIDALATRAAADPVLDPECNSIKALRWVALARSGARSDALRAIDEAQAGSSDYPFVILTAVRVLLANDKKTDVSSYLDRVTNLMKEDAEPSLQLMLADLLLFSERGLQAAKIYEKYAFPGYHSEIHKKLLRALLQSNQRSRAKAALDLLPENWSADDETRGYAIELANAAGDWHRLLPLAILEVEHDPVSAAAWLLRLHVEVRVSDTAAFFKLLAQIPDELRGSIKQIAQIGSLEIRYGLASKGMQRLYRVFRRNMEDADAAEAYMMCLLLAPGDLPFMELSLPVIRAGTSFCLKSERGEDGEFTIDPVDVGDLPRTAQFFQPNDEKAKDFLGKAVGDEIVIERQFGTSHRFVVKSISSAYRYLLEVTQRRAYSPFEGLPNVTTIQIRKENGEVDLSEMHQMLKRNSGRSLSFFQAYETSPATLGICARLLGKSPIDVVTSWPQDGPPMRTCRGDTNERDDALSILNEPEVKLAIDLATLAELVMFKGESSLGAVKKVYVSALSQQMLKSLRSEIENDQSKGSAADIHGQMRFFETSGLQRSQQVDFLQRIQAVIDKYCEVVPSYGALDIPNEYAKLEGLIGDDEYQAVLMAHEYNAVLLSLDIHLRELAKAMLEVRGVFPQALFLTALKTEHLSPEGYISAIGGQYLSNRSYVSVNGQIVVRLCLQSDRYLRATLFQIRQVFSSPSTDLASATQVVEEVLYHLLRYHPPLGVMMFFVEQLFEPLFRHPNCPSDLMAGARWIIFKFIGKTGISNIGVPQVDVVEQRTKSATTTLLLRSLGTSLLRSKEPLQNFPPTISVIMGTKQPSFVLKGERSLAVAKNVEPTPLSFVSQNAHR